MPQASEGRTATDTEAVQATALTGTWTLELRRVKAIVLRIIRAEYGDSGCRPRGSADSARRVWDNSRVACC